MLLCCRVRSKCAAFRMRQQDQGEVQTNVPSAWITSGFHSSVPGFLSSSIVHIEAVPECQGLASSGETREQDQKHKETRSGAITPFLTQQLAFMMNIYCVLK